MAYSSPEINGKHTPFVGKSPLDDAKRLEAYLSKIVTFLNGQDTGKISPPPKGSPEYWATLSSRIKTAKSSEEAVPALRQILAEYPEDSEVILDTLERYGWKDPDRPPKPRRLPPSLADARKFQQGVKWIWPGHILGGQLTLLTGESGAGKSTGLVELLARTWFGNPWPDGSPPTLEPGRPVLWLNSDQRVGQMFDLFELHGLPDEACYLAHDQDSPMNPLNLDDPGVLEKISQYVEDVNPWALIVDTVSRATGQDICSLTGVTEVTKGLLELSNRTGIAVILLGHTNKEGDAYGRHLKTACQVCIKLEGNSSTTSRVWKNDTRHPSQAPEPIGITIQPDGKWKWGETPALDDRGKAVVCADHIRDLIQRNGRMSWNELLGSLNLRGEFLKPMVSSCLKSLVLGGELIVMDAVGTKGAKYKLWELVSPPSSAELEQGENERAY